MWSGWTRQFVPWLLLLSLIGNLFLTLQVWQRDRYANQFLWGNAVSMLTYHTTRGPSPATGRR